MSLEKGPQNKFTKAADEFKAAQLSVNAEERRRIEHAEYLRRTRRERLLLERQSAVDNLMENGVLALFVEAARGIRQVIPDVEVRLTVPDDNEFKGREGLRKPTMGVALLFDFKRSGGKVTYTRIGASDFNNGSGFQLNYGSEVHNNYDHAPTQKKVVMIPDVVYSNLDLIEKKEKSQVIVKDTRATDINSAPMPGFDYFEYTDEGLVEAGDVIADLIQSGDASRLRATSFMPRPGWVGKIDGLMHDDEKSQKYYSYISVPLD